MENKIHNEIADIAPTLASMEKHNPFIVPDGYFSTLEDRILDTIAAPATSTASVPDGYFDDLADKVIAKINTNEEAKIVPLFKKRWLSIAASLIVILGVSFLLNTQINAPDKNNEFVLDIQPEAALDYLIENDNLYLSDLMSLDLLEDEFTLEDPTITNLENVDIDALLNELDQEDLEELL